MSLSPESLPLPAASPQTVLATLWQRGLPRLRRRLEQLDRAASAALSGALSEDLRSQATVTAHNLAGSLGMFGYVEATGTARTIELLLEAPGETDPMELRILTERLHQALNL